MVVDIVSLTIEPVCLQHIGLVALGEFLGIRAVLAHLDHAQVVEAATEESTVLLVCKALLMHGRLEVQILVLDLVVVVLERLVLIFVRVHLHLHLVLEILLLALLRHSCLLILCLNGLLELLDLPLQLKLLQVPLVLENFVLGAGLLQRLVGRCLVLRHSSIDEGLAMLVELALQFCILARQIVQLLVDCLEAHLRLPQSLLEVVLLVFILTLLLPQRHLLLLRRG